MKKKIAIVFFLPFLLMGCSYTSLIFDPYDYGVAYSNKKVASQEDNYYSLAEYGTLSYLSTNQEEKTINSFRDVYSSTSTYDTRKYLNINSHGEQNLLVIPISFKDSDKNNQGDKKIIIENAFFGQPDKTIYESVASYFNKSSYGDLKINGLVTDFINLDYYSYQLEDIFGSYTRTSRELVALLIDQLKQTSDINWDQFDLDKDNCIDGVYVIYDYPYSEKSNSSLFWAYSDQTQVGINGRNTTIPYASSYSWSSYDFIHYKGNYANTHTIIHEVGHLFGLDDYYNTYENGDYQPTGYMDMMDYNIGDHSGFSKMLLDWVSPKVVVGEGEIDIAPFYSSGELILIPAGQWNQTPYDEYLLIEYFAPKGLNEKEQAFTFTYIDENNHEKSFSYLSYYGLKVYHVDARLAYFERKTSTSYIGLLDDPNIVSELLKYDTFCIDFAHDNSVFASQASQKPTLLHLLQKSGENTFLKGEPMRNEDLWILGDTFGVDTFVDFTFNNGEKLSFTFEVSAMNTNQAIIRFTYK